MSVEGVDLVDRFRLFLQGGHGAARCRPDRQLVAARAFQLLAREGSPIPEAVSLSSATRLQSLGGPD